MASNASCGWGGVGGAWTGTECVCANGWRNDRHLFAIDNCSVHLGVDITYAIVLGLLGLRLLGSSAWAWNHSDRIKKNPEYAGIAMACGVYGVFIVVEPCSLFVGTTSAEGFVIHTVSWMMKEVVVGFMMLLVCTLLRESVNTLRTGSASELPSALPPFLAAVARILLAAATTVTVTTVSTVGVNAAAAVYGAQSFAAVAQMTIAASYTGRLASVTSDVSRSTLSNDTARAKAVKSSAARMRMLYVWTLSDAAVRSACAIVAACLYAIPESGTMRPAFIPLTFASAFNAFWLWWYFSRTFRAVPGTSRAKGNPSPDEALVIVAS